MSEMTPRERWMAYLNRKPVDRLPTDYWSTGEFHARFKKDLGIADDETLWRKLRIDRPAGIWGRQVVAHHPDDPSADIWGVRYTNIDYGTGVYNETSHHPLAGMMTVDEINAFKWPTVDYMDFSAVGDLVKKQDGYRMCQGGGYEPFLLYCNLRGMEQAYEDLLVNEEIAETILEHIFQFYYHSNRKLYEAANGGIDVLYMAEDLGSQSGPLVSMEVYHKFLMPRQKMMADMAKSFGVHVFYHTDGAARVFLPDLVNTVGIEILNPIQWRCPTMERDGLAKDYGDKIIFHGAVDNQYTLPFGTPEEVRQEVQDCARLFEGCRWICAPCHNIQPNTPTANVVAMYEEASRIAWR
jgi:uroporphyrinogen decarboxylase